jgi:hypothetical protein
VAVLAFYWGPPAYCGWPLLWLIVAHTWFATIGQALQVAANAAVTQIFPTTLRGTILGWLTFTTAADPTRAGFALVIDYYFDDPPKQDLGSVSQLSLGAFERSHGRLPSNIFLERA